MVPRRTNRRLVLKCRIAISKHNINVAQLLIVNQLNLIKIYTMIVPIFQSTINLVKEINNNAQH